MHMSVKAVQTAKACLYQGFILADSYICIAEDKCTLL